MLNLMENVSIKTETTIEKALSRHEHTGLMVALPFLVLALMPSPAYLSQ